MASSNRSISSVSGITSSSAKSAARARAKAEAAKVRASYASKEAELKVEKAKSELEKTKIDAELEVLTLQREAHAAEAEAEVLEKAEASQDGQDNRNPVFNRVKRERTNHYVQSQITCQSGFPRIPVPTDLNPTPND